MKKLLCNIMAIGLAFSPVATIVSCSRNSDSNNDGGNTPNTPDDPGTPDTPSIDDKDLLVTNNITNYWTARQFLSDYYNVSLTDFALDWMDQSTLRLRPVHGTTFESVYTNLIDYKINTGFSGDSNSSLSIFSDLTGPITGRKIELPYNSTLSSSDDTADQANEGYFGTLQLISGIKLDSSKYTYSFTASTSDTDDTLKGTFSIVNNDDENDTVTLDVKTHIISFDEFFDTYQIPGPVYLPDEIKGVETSDFSVLNNLNGKAPTLMAYVNKYRDIDWQDSALNYYAADLENYYTDISMSGLNNDAIVLEKNYSDDESSGTLGFGTKWDDKFDSGDFKDMGILKADSNDYITETIINFKPEDDINDIFFSYPNTIVKGTNGLAKYSKGVCTSSPADGLTDIASTDDTYKNDTELSVFGNCYQFDKWSISSTTEDELKMKQEFVKELYNVTGFEVPDDQYLYNDVRIKKDGDSVYAYLNRYSNIYNNNVYKVMYYPGKTFLKIGAMDLYEGCDQTTGSYCFKLTQ